MKRNIIAIAGILLSVCIPSVSADPKVKGWNTLDSMGCMMLKECADGTERIHTWKDLGQEYKPWSNELERIFASMKKIGIEAYVADRKYFVPRTRGLYDTKKNNFFLNEQYLTNPEMVVGVIRHEGWHAVQDCMAGTIDNGLTGVVWPDTKVPKWVKRGAELTYETNPKAIPFEAEAMYAAFSDYETVDALEVCADPNRVMWEEYPPTSMTGEWLLKNGYINK